MYEVDEEGRIIIGGSEQVSAVIADPKVPEIHFHQQMGPYRASDETPEYRSIARYDEAGKTLDQRVSDSSPIGQQSLQAGPSRLYSKGSAS